MWKMIRDDIALLAFINGNEINQNVEPCATPLGFSFLAFFYYFTPWKRIFLLHKNEKIKKSFSKKFHWIPHWRQFFSIAHSLSWHLLNDSENKKSMFGKFEYLKAIGKIMIVNHQINSEPEFLLLLLCLSCHSTSYLCRQFFTFALSSSSF